MVSSTEIYSAVINPFLDEAKSLLQDSPPFEELPENIVDKAASRVTWESGSDMKVYFDDDAVREDVLSFYLMCQAVASVSYPYSSEAGVVVDSVRDTIRYRLYDLFNRGREDLCLETISQDFRFRELEGERGSGDVELGDISIPRHDIFKLRDMELERDGFDPDKQNVSNETLPQYVPKYAIRWTDLTSLIEHRKMDLTSQYIVDGWALLAPKRLWEFFADFIASEAEDYISDLYERFSDEGSPSDVLKGVGTRISENIPEQKSYDRVSSSGSEDLNQDAFPPCIKSVMSGVQEGNRNYGIVALLTSFLSYARISPSGESVNRIADYVEDISVVEEDIVPLIFEAAKNCNPPLFEDQPQDKANVYYHMGFGMTTQPRLKESGKSKWYRPPNCRKIKTESPGLCNPDELCSEVKNPLTYYFKKDAELSSSGGD